MNTAKAIEISFLPQEHISAPPWDVLFIIWTKILKRISAKTKLYFIEKRMKTHETYWIFNYWILNQNRRKRKKNRRTFVVVLLLCSLHYSYVFCLPFSCAPHLSWGIQSVVLCLFRYLYQNKISTILKNTFLGLENLVDL